MMTYDIDKILQDLKDGKITVIDARFRIFDAINEDIKQQIAGLDCKLDEVLEG